MLTILASADHHLGMKFAAYPSVQAELAEARFHTLKRLVDSANQRECVLFLIAGDLFDRVSVSTKDVHRSADLLNSFQGQLVVILPGNHDFYSGEASTLWARFNEAAGDRILLLREPKVYDLRHYDLNVLLAAAPCDSKHAKSNAISWLQDTAAQAALWKANGTLRLGVAHGSIEGISPDAQGVYFPMKRAELSAAPLDGWIIGHTHRQYPEPGNATSAAALPLLIPGTPEPDGFDCRHAGTAWMLEVQENGRIRSESLSTGTYRFLQQEYTLESAEDVVHFSRALPIAKGEKTLLRLKINGRLDPENLLEVRRLLSETEASLLFTQIDDSGLLERISEQTVEAEFSQGSFPYRLLKQLIAEEDFEALQTAYALLQEQRS